MLEVLIGARSHFSLGESMLTPKEIVEKAAEVGAKAVSLTDTMTISGMVEFSNAAKKADIKPIVGCRIRVVEDPMYRKPKKGSGDKEKPNPEWFCNVFVKNDGGIKDLIKLLSLANSDDYYYYVPRVGLEDLLKTLSLGNLTFSTGDFYSVFHLKDYQSKLELIRASVSESSAYIELVPIKTPLFDKLNQLAMNTAAELGMKTVVSYPSLYADDADAETLQVMAAISSNTKMDAPWRNKQYVQDFSIRSLKDRVVRTKDSLGRISKFYGSVNLVKVKEAVTNLDGFQAEHTYEWAKLPVSLPIIAKDEFAELTKAVKEGWVKRLGKPTLGYQPGPADTAKYIERLKYEMSVLKTMQFERYFLMVSDLVNWSKSSGIMVGPGRGSAGGSLVAYLMGITDVDPIRFGLFFERFINPDRLDLPDVDLDFMSSRRGEVIEYLINKYGEDRVAGISNYGTMASASALRDTGRVFSLSNDDLSATRYVPKEHGSPIPLNDAADQVAAIMAFREEQPEIWEHAVRLEGKMRSLGRHAAGVVVAGEPINNRGVVEKRSGSKVVNWDKRVVEDWGLIKMDILGLSTLDTITKAIELIGKSGTKVELTKLPLDDKAVIEAFGQGNTIGIFQFEGNSSRRLLRDVAASGSLSFGDVTAITALNRPGPLDAGLTQDYVAIKNGRKAEEYDHPSMEPALKETYGVMVYQEQIMQVVRDLAGFTMTEADHVRKAIGKKDMTKMKEMKDKFIEGAMAGFVEVELEDGTTKKVHRTTKFMCADGVKRTVEEAAEADVDIDI